MDNLSVTLYINGSFICTLQGLLRNITYYPAAAFHGSGMATFNFGDTAFLYDIPQGYSAYKYAEFPYYLSSLSINPISLYQSSCNICLSVSHPELESGTIDLDLVNSNGDIVEAKNCLLNRKYDFVVPYNSILNDGILILKDKERSNKLKQAQLRKEIAYRTQAYRTFTEIEAGYKNKNLVQLSKLKPVI